MQDVWLGNIQTGIYAKQEPNTTNMKKSLLFVALSVLIVGTSFGQDEAKSKTKRKFNYFAIGLHGGWTQFYGDIRQYDFGYAQAKYDVNNGAGGFFVDYQLNSVIGFRANVLVGTLGGSKRGKWNTL